MSTIDQPTPERTTTVNDNTPDWDGAPVVQTAIGTLWVRQLDGRYRHYFHHGDTRAPEELAPLNPKPVKLHPATTPEPRTVTWRKGEDTTEISEAWYPGRRARVVTETVDYTVTRDGKINGYWQYGPLDLEGWLSDDRTTSITVWLPETPKVPEWAQDCDNSLRDWRLAVTDDGRVWVPIDTHDNNIITRWGTRGGKDANCTTDELDAMGARLIVDRYGRVR